MLLVADRGNNRVHRYDPVNDVYLGSFGDGYFTNIYDIDVDQATGLAYVLDEAVVGQTKRIHVFNYSTGEYVFQHLIGVPGVTGEYDLAFGAKNGNFNTVWTVNNGVGGELRRHQLAPGGAIVIETIAPLVGNAGWTGVAHAGGNTYFLADFDLASSAAGTAALWWRSAPGVASQMGGVNGTTLIQNARNLAARDTLSSQGVQLGITGAIPGNFAYWDPQAFGSIGSGGVIADLSSIGWTQTYDVAVGHYQLVHTIGRNATGPVMMSKLASAVNFGRQRQLSGSIFSNNIAGMAIVVAPEPTSLCALVLGAAFMVRRRRKNRQS